MGKMANGINHFPNSEFGGRLRKQKAVHQPITFFTAMMVYFSTFILLLVGHFRDFVRSIGLEKIKTAVEINREGYAPLYKSFESFYTRNIYRRMCDGWNQPIASVPGAIIKVVKRITNDNNWTFRLSDDYTNCINMGSYNYLGFAENSGKRTDSVEECINIYKIGVGSSRHELGTINIHGELEEHMARFLGVEDCIIIGMGFATNSTNIPSITGKGCLLLSDELNHASLVLGCRLSGSTIRTFKHNDIQDLERKIRSSILEGQPRSRKPWKKIIIIVEGVWSMEGTIVNLPEVIALKKRYKTYLYLDEAHSIGAIGHTGRGVTELFNCDPNDVDLLMGTYTKSFGAAGGYIAGRKQVIDHIRIHSHSLGYACSMSPCIAQQILSVLKMMLCLDGANCRDRIETLARNTRYFRKNLKRLGFVVYGNDDSPVVPIMIYFSTKLLAFVRMARDMGIATVGAGFPATPLLEARIRFCLSASHTKEMLDEVLAVTSKLGDRLKVKYSTSIYDKGEEIIY